MTRPSTLRSRNLSVTSKVTLTTFSVLGQSPYTVDPPFTCEPGKNYRVELDDATRTATITEVSA